MLDVNFQFFFKELSAVHIIIMQQFWSYVTALDFFGEFS